MKLADLLTAAASGTAVLTDGSGGTLELNALGAARLYAAVAADRTRMGLFLVDVPTASVELESAEDYVITVAGVLRYMVDNDENAASENAVDRMCTTPRCPGLSIGVEQYTRVCEDHLDTVIPGMLPSAGDDILPSDRENAARASRQKRLDAWEQEIEDREREAAGERRILAKLRQG